MSALRPVVDTTVTPQKKVKEMTLEEQIAYYQNKASKLKKRRAEERRYHFENIGRIFERVFGEVSGSDKEIEEVFRVMLDNITKYHHQLKQTGNTK